MHLAFKAQTQRDFFPIPSGDVDRNLAAQQCNLFGTADERKPTAR